MRSITTVGAGILAAAALAACGSAGTPQDHGSASQKSASRPTQQGYFNMDTLASDLKSQIQQKIDGDPTLTGAKVDSVDCISTGGQTATCNDQVTDSTGNEQGYTVQVTISKDGSEYITSNN